MKKNNILFLAVTVVLIGLGVAVSSRLRPLTVFILRSSANSSAEAFRIQQPLNPGEPAVETLRLGPAQLKEARDILDRKDGAGLLEFSKNFGTFAVVAGMTTNDDGWPWFLGGGMKNLFHGDNGSLFDNLQWPDRLYLCFATNTPPPAPFTPAPIQVDLGSGVSRPPTVVAGPTATPSSAGVVRVEIQNGCGITNAADWVARRIKGPQVTITDTGNADNFHYPKTLVRTAVGVPVALEEALERLGLAKDSVEDAASLPANIDVVVIVGKDFRSLKERFRERNHH